MKAQIAKQTAPQANPPPHNLSLTSVKFERPARPSIMVWSRLFAVVRKGLGKFKNWGARPDLDFEHWKRIEYRNEHVEDSRREAFRGYRTW